MTIAEKKQLLKNELDKLGDGSRSRLAVQVSISTRQVSNWLDPECGWMSLKNERKVWEFLDFSLDSQGNPIRSQGRNSNGKLDLQEVNAELDQLEADLFRLTESVRRIRSKTAER